MYKDEKTGLSLFELQLNQCGKGIPKFSKGSGKEPPLLDILEGRVDAAYFSPDKIKYRLINEGYLDEKCSSCGFNERRLIDYRIPLLLHFKDKNKNNYKRENLELLCYNHYFLYIGDIFNKYDIQQIEDHVPVSRTTERVEWELDPYHLHRLKELGLTDDDEDDVNKYISRI
jgi:hypothetical protein